MGLDQSVRLTAIDFFLQLEQNVCFVIEEGVDNLLGIWSSSEAVGKENEATPIDRHLKVHLNGLGLWQRRDLIHATHCARCIILNFLTVPVNWIQDYTL